MLCCPDMLGTHHISTHHSCTLAAITKKMSTTFEIIPVETKNLTFRQVLELAKSRINSFFETLNISTNIQLKVNLHENNEKYVMKIKFQVDI